MPTILPETLPPPPMPPRQSKRMGSGSKHSSSMQPPNAAISAQSKMHASNREDSHREEKKSDDAQNSQGGSNVAEAQASRDNANNVEHHQHQKQPENPRQSPNLPQQSSLEQRQPLNGSNSQHQPIPARPMLPVMLMNRPPSTTSIMSNTSQGAPARGAPGTTTTSRRGGRTRCRSPPAMIPRPGSANQYSHPNAANTPPPPSHAPANGATSSGSDYGSPDDRPGPSSRTDASHPVSTAVTPATAAAPSSSPADNGTPSSTGAVPTSPNPSAAAAAAAATAKSLANTAGGGPSRARPPPTSWGYPGSDNVSVSSSTRGPPPHEDDRYARHPLNGNSDPSNNPSNRYMGSDMQQQGPPSHLSNSARYSSYPPPHQDSRYDHSRESQYASHYHHPPSSHHPHPHHSHHHAPSHHSASRGPWPPQDSSGRPTSASRSSAYPPSTRHTREEHYGYREGYRGGPPPPPSDGYGGAYGRPRTGREPYYDDPHLSRHTAPPPHHHHSGAPPDYDRRYGPPSAHYDESIRQTGGRHETSTSPHPSSNMYDHHNGRPVDPYYRGPPAQLPPSSSSSKSGMVPLHGSIDPKSAMEMKRPMTRVIGTPTPIHLPMADDGDAGVSDNATIKASGNSNNKSKSKKYSTSSNILIDDIPPAGSINRRAGAQTRSQSSSSRGSRGGSASSVFRRADSGMGRDAPTQSKSQTSDDSQHKLLMSLRTPTSSFDEKGQSICLKTSDSQKHPNEPLTLPMSPAAPPQIQHAHNKRDQESTLLFEPQRSPKSYAGPPQPSASLEMAPSFSLFNQSFDSFGDTAQYFNVGGPLDLQASFGAGPIASIDPHDKGDLQLHHSNSTTQQLLSGSGSALTFSMSPSNSFGAGPPMRTGSMLMLGGQDARSSSPTQVLGMYRSYSGIASPRAKASPLEDTHLRMSNSSIGMPSIGHAYTRSFGGEAPPVPYRSPTLSLPVTTFPAEAPDGSPGFYMFLRKYRGAFKNVTFLLPGLKAALLENPVHDSKTNSTSAGKRENRHERDIAIAARRITCAVCAFGGTTVKGGVESLAPKQKAKSSQSIFRQKSSESTAVTPGSSAPGSSHNDRANSKYEEALPSRYYENDNRLSWEFEERPPIVELEDGESILDQNRRADKLKMPGNSGRDMRGSPSQESPEDDDDKKMSSSSSQASTPSEQPKMKYRCKLCGQPKQNHTCPYQQSMARSIGTMTYPAVNAFIADEPGKLAPGLSEMNNFVSGGDSVTSENTSPSRPTPDRTRVTNPMHGVSTAQVTPDSLRSTVRGASSPMSALSNGSTTPKRSSPTNRPSPPRNPKTPVSTATRKRSLAQMSGDEQGELLFLEQMEIKPEQYRIVTPSQAMTKPDAFTYAPLPLPYAQRKRLSDNLFTLSKQVEYLTDECATVLREAREKDCWDVAVAELMTQVVTVVHCREGDDSQFDGLRQYLLTLGIAC